MKSARITLMTLASSGQPLNSHNEGEYVWAGLRGAFADARTAASNPNGFFRGGETHVVVAIFPLGEGPIRVLRPKFRIAA
jgi:hypothetical protein